ncbi:MAG: serine hydrolase [Clostridia bacterium]|nr:serine hydrolase [Clostridia bacterium]
MAIKTKISSEWIYRFYKGLEKNGIENHGLIIMQGGETVFEEYAYPYSADMPHTMFSLTKSIVSTAAGFAIEEGLFSLDSKILPLFPEYEHCESDEWNNLTVRSVLTMQSNKEFSFLQDMTGNYAEMFMKAPFRKNKGFLYSNNDAHIVAAIVQKTSGMNLVDYLTPRLFEPLGINPPNWETNSIDECIGGTGAYMTLRDLAKICRCYADGGMYNGKQVIPEWWTKEATKKQVDLGKRENEDGYGYLFWIYDDIYSMTGMFGQQISYFPKHDAVIAVFNCAINDDENAKLMRNVLSKAFEEESTEEWDEKLADYLHRRGEKPVVCDGLPEIPTGKTFYITPLSDVLAKLMFPASIIPRSLTSSFAKRPKGNLNRVSFEICNDVFSVKWYEEEDEITINCGLDGNPRLSECSIKGYPYKIWAYAFMKNGVLNAVVKPINTLATQYMTFDFSENCVKIAMKSAPSFPEFIKKNAGQSSFVKNSGLFKPVIVKGLDWFLKTAEMPMKFNPKK